MMKSLIAASAASLLALAGGTHAQEAAPSAPAPHALLVDTKGEAIGTVVAEQTPSGVLVAIVATGLPEGEHAFHIHEKGVCDASTGFTSAGGHYAPAANAHGYRAKGGHHAGDMPNLFVAADGSLSAQVLNSSVTLIGGDAPLADADGSAIVIHAAADDYSSQPSGAAGDRIACAVLASPGK